MRIGVIQCGRLIEEKLVRQRAHVTVGQSVTNMFSVPSEALPRSWRIFEFTADGYVARLDDGMDARVAVGSEMVSFSQLRQKTKMEMSGNVFLLPLDERSRGKITIGDTTLLFQFVAPPSPQPLAQLPVSVRGTLTTNLDWVFSTIAAASFILHFSLVIYLQRVDWPRKPNIEEVPDVFKAMVNRIQIPAPERSVASLDETKPDGGKTAPTRPARKPKAVASMREPKALEEQVSPEEMARRTAERRAEIARQVGNLGIIKMLGSKGDGAIADLLKNGDVDRAQEEAFRGLPSVRVAYNDPIGSIRHVTEGTGTMARLELLRGAVAIDEATVGAVGNERRINAVVKQESPTIDGILDPGIVSKEVKRRIGAIKACYERALRRNPALGGKVALYWTITSAGTVSSVEVEQDTLNDAEVTGCMKQLVKGWRFPGPAGGSVDVSFPFVFQSSGE